MDEPITEQEVADSLDADSISDWILSCAPASQWNSDSAEQKYFSGPIIFEGETVVFNALEDATMEDLSNACEEYWDNKKKDKDGNPVMYDWAKHKFLAPPPVGMLKGPENKSFPLARIFGEQGCLHNKRNAAIRLMVPRAVALKDIRAAEEAFKHVQEVRASRRRISTWKRRSQQAANSQYTFQSVRALDRFSNSDRAQDFLLRLRDDVGIRHVMNKHKFTVGLLTEMDPAAHTQHSHEGTSRTLGLNRNQGQVIELRLRTDAYDGFRDYKSVRNTLCHELTHNVHGPHDSNFWALCHQLEREVNKADYNMTGRTLDDGAVYRPSPATAREAVEEDHTDFGGWTGGTFVLGDGSRSSGNGAYTRGSTSNDGDSSRPGNAQAMRDRAARAAEERRRAANNSENNGAGNGQP